MNEISWPTLECLTCHKLTGIIRFNDIGHIIDISCHQCWRSPRDYGDTEVEVPSINYGNNGDKFEVKGWVPCSFLSILVFFAAYGILFLLKVL